MLHNLKNFRYISSRVTLVEMGQDSIVERLDCRDNEGTTEVLHLREQALMPQKMFDFDGYIKRHAGMLPMHFVNQLGGMLGTV